MKIGNDTIWYNDNRTIDMFIECNPIQQHGPLLVFRFDALFSILAMEREIPYMYRVTWI